MGALALLSIGTPFALLLLLVVLGRIEQRFFSGEPDRVAARESVNYSRCAYERGARARGSSQPACIHGRKPVPNRARPPTPGPSALPAAARTPQTKS